MSDEIKLGFYVTHDEMTSFMKSLEEMQAKEVLAGFPQEKDIPREDKDGNPSPITNAALAYIHNTGMPEQNIPARPFMVEGIEEKRAEITNKMKAAGLAALDGDSQEVEAALIGVGIAAQSGIQMKITDGPFVPLADSTLKARARGDEDRSAYAPVAQAAQRELDSRAAGNAPSVEDARPLTDTAQMKRAVNFVLRDK